MATRRSNDSRTTAPTSSSPGRAAGSAALTRAEGSAAERPARRRESAASKEQQPAATVSPASVSSEARRAMIAQAAYLRAERRGFAPGFEEDDWLTAEKEVDALLGAGQGGSQ